MRYLTALLRPRSAFDGWMPGVGVAVGVVVLLCVLNGVSVAHAGDAVASEVTGSVAVDNPQRPPEWMCEENTSMDAEAFGDCDASETVQQPLRPTAQEALDGVVLKAALAPVAWILLVASLFVVLSNRIAGADGSALGAFGDGVRVAAIAAVPGAIRYLARPVAVERSLADWTHPETLEAVGPAAVRALFPDGPLWLAAVAVSTGWTALVVYGGVRAVNGSDRDMAAVVAMAAVLPLCVSVALRNSGWTGVPGGFGLLCVAVGVVALLGARTYISVSKEFELVGFRGSRHVEPTEWYVGLHRLAGLCIVVLGFVLLDGVALG